MCGSTVLRQVEKEERMKLMCEIEEKELRLLGSSRQKKIHSELT